MSDTVVVLSYKRDVGDTCTGDVRVGEVHVTFSQLRYRKMLQLLATFATPYNAKRVDIVRLERPELLPMQLDEATVALMKVDMVEFIHRLCFGNDQPVEVDFKKVVEAKERQEKAVPMVAGVLLGGLATLAEAIGDEVYCVYKMGEIECPLCGRWHEAHYRGGGCYGGPVPQYRLTHTWAIVSVVHLLGLPVERYYFPREWNPSHGWISKKDLTELYRSSLQERTAT